MTTDNALAHCKFHWDLRSGDTGRRGTECRSFNLLWFTHNLVKTGQRGLWFLRNRLRAGQRRLWLSFYLMIKRMGPEGGIGPPSRESC